MSVKQAASPVLPGRERACPPVGKGCGQGSSRRAPARPGPRLSLEGFGRVPLCLWRASPSAFFSYCPPIKLLRLPLRPALSIRGKQTKTRPVSPGTQSGPCPARHWRALPWGRSYRGLWFFPGEEPAVIFAPYTWSNHDSCFLALIKTGKLLCALCPPTVCVGGRRPLWDCTGHLVLCTLSCC